MAPVQQAPRPPRIPYNRDRRSFEIRLEFESDVPIRFESDGPIRKFRIATPATFVVVP